MMLKDLVFSSCLFAAGIVVHAAGAAETPSWAYLDNPPGVTPAPDTGAPLHVPDSDGAFTLTEIRNLFFSGLAPRRP